MVPSHVLYRFFDSTDRLLYVGITSNPPRRFRDHSRGKWWWEQISTIRMQRYTSREELAEAESQAIATEWPLYNITSNRNSIVVPCPTCGLKSFYYRELDQYLHLEKGSFGNNFDCKSWRDRFGGVPRPQGHPRP